MYSFAYGLFFALKRNIKARKLAGKIIPRGIVKMIDYCEWFYNVPVARWYQKFPSQKTGITKKKREQKIVVSLTSYPKRINTICLTIETLLRQSIKPDEIILWLAESQFENGINSLPENLLRLQARGLTIRFCADLRSHKKYHFALQEFSNDLVVLADDDMFYPRDTIKKLMRMHRKWPEDICCITSQVIEPGFSAVPSKWRNPHLVENLQHTDTIQAYTGSGTLIPPGAFPVDIFMTDIYQKICPYADDLWLAFHAHRTGTKITTLKRWRPFPIAIYGTSEGSLYYINGEGRQNDVQWQNLLDYYGVDL